MKINKIGSILVIFFLLSGCVQQIHVQVNKTVQQPFAQNNITQQVLRQPNITSEELIINKTGIELNNKSSADREPVKIINVTLAWKYSAKEGEIISLATDSPFAVSAYNDSIYLFREGKIGWNNSHGNISFVSISPSAKYIAILEENKISLLDKEGKILCKSNDIKNASSLFAFDNLVVLEVDEGKNERKMHLLNNECKTIGNLTINIPTAYITPSPIMAISPDGKYFAITSISTGARFIDPEREMGYLGTETNSVLYILNTTNGQVIWKKDLEEHLITGVSLSNNLIAVSTSHLKSAIDIDMPLYLFDMQGKEILNFKAKNGFIGIAVAKNGKYVAAGSRDGNVYFFDKKGNLIWKKAGGDYLVAISENYIATVSSANLYLFDKNGNLLWEHEATKELPVRFPKSLSISQDENYLLFSAYKGAPGEPEEVYIFKMQSASEPPLTPIAPSQQTYTSEGQISASSKPVIESISPLSRPIGTEVIIRGSGFTPTNNDIGFTHRDINFQGKNTAYLDNVSSPDGKVLSFTLPGILGACPMSQLKLDENEACPAVGIPFPTTGDIQIFVVNKNGISNSVSFNVSS